jgi:hypothetical protein
MMAALLTSSVLAQGAANDAVEGPVAIATVLPDEVASTGPVIVNDMPDSNAPPTDPIVYVVVIVLAVLLVAALVFGAQIVNALKTLVPPEIAFSIYQAGVRFGLQMALNEAAKTPTDVDDAFFKKLAADRGLIVNRSGTGAYEVIYADPPEMRTPTPSVG